MRFKWAIAIRHSHFLLRALCHESYIAIPFVEEIFRSSNLVVVGLF